MKIKHNFYFYVPILLLVVIVSSIVFPLLKETKFAGQADEGYYRGYASAIAEKGLSEFKNLFTGYIENKEAWMFPNPLRIGFIALSSVFCRIFGNSFMALAYLSFLSFLVFIVINYYFCARIFDNEKAILLSVLIAFSPLNLAMARRALSDSTFLLIWALAAWLFLDMLIKDKRIIKRVIFLCVFIFSILVKETSVFLIIPFFIFALAYKMMFKGVLKWADLLYISVYPAILLLWIYYLASGSLGRIADVVNLVSTAVNYNQYAIMFGSGPWYRYIIDYLVLSPWVVILSLGFIFHYFISKDNDARIFYFLTLLIITFFIFNFFTLNVRYVIILDMPMRLLSVIMLRAIFGSRFPKAAFILSLVAVFFISAFDYINFRSLFLSDNIYDPVSFSLLKSKHIIPWQQ